MKRRPLLAGAAIMFVVLAAFYVLSIDIRASRSATITGDEPFYLLTTQSLLQDGNLDLRQQYEQRSYTSFFDHPDGLWRQSVPTSDGRLLSPHNPGLSVFVIPGFALAGLAGVQVQLLAIAALTFALAYVLIARLTGAALLTWLVTLAIGAGATPFVYATEVYPEVPAALAVVVSLLLLLDTRPGLWRALGLAIALTALVWLGVKYVPLAILIAAFFLWKARPSGRAALIGLAVPSAVTFVWFHLATFGELTPYSVNTVYAGSSTIEVIDSHVSIDDRLYRLWGLFLDRRFGIARWSPLLLLAIPGFVYLLRGAAIARLFFGLIAAQILVATFVAITMMGWWFPGRTLMTVFPLFALPIVLLLKGSGRLRLVAAVLASYSLLITATLAYAGHAREVFIAVNPFDIGSPWFRLPGNLFPQYTSWGLETRLLTAGWLIAAVAAIVLSTAGVRDIIRKFRSTVRDRQRGISPDRRPRALPDQPEG